MSRRASLCEGRRSVPALWVAPLGSHRAPGYACARGAIEYLEAGAAATIVQGLARAVMPMFSFDRPSQRLLLSWALAALLPLGCTLITDVDRSKIPQPPVIEPDPRPSDAGTVPSTPDAADGSDAGALPDAAPDATVPVSDAGAEPTDAQADGG
jgi:hypothetical protein